MLHNQSACMHDYTVVTSGSCTDVLFARKVIVWHEAWHAKYWHLVAEQYREGTNLGDGASQPGKQSVPVLPPWRLSAPVLAT